MTHEGVSPVSETSMTNPDPTQIFASGITFDDAAGGYGGRVEVTSYRLPEDDPKVVLTVSSDGVIASVERSMSPAELREMAGAFERAADHADAVRARAENELRVIA